MYTEIIEDIKKYESKERILHYLSFFRTKKGGYGEGDKFYGLTNPQIRDIVKKYKKDISLADIKKLITNPFHEVRLTAILFLVEKFNKAKLEDKKQIVKIYVDNAKFINNWDLVDLSVYHILGKYCLEINDYSILYQLSKTKHLWSERMAIVANWILFRNGVYDVFLNIAPDFISHKHDLIHKAIGWMLREMGKSSAEGYKLLIKFLDEYAFVMPRTMLRYSLEQLSPNLKKKYMEKR